jgi:hypothetical protein
MELILKSNNEQSLDKIIALAKRLDVAIVKKNTEADNTNTRETLKNRILNYNAPTFSSFGDAAEWQKKQREDRELPFS